MRKPPLLQRLRAKKQVRSAGPVVVGVSWYSEDEWAKVKSFAADPDVFEASFDEWLAMAESALGQLTSMGIVPTKVFIEAQAFKEWCARKSMPNNAQSRSEYVSERIQLTPPPTA
jgi:hypothetical protein